jgi:hypothetical protein
MFKKMVVAGFILLAGSQSVYAQGATQAAINEAGHLRLAKIKDRVHSQRVEIELALVKKTITAEQAKECGGILDQVEGQVAVIAGTDGQGIMLADAFDSYSAFLDVNYSLISNQDQLMKVASKNHNPNS